MARPSHSEKTLETLRVLGCTVDGWRLPDIKFERQMLPVQTKVTCPVCHGYGMVADEKVRAAAALRVKAGERVSFEERHAQRGCPECVSYRNPRKGTGKVTQWVEREVEVGVIQWPEGTKFGSRFEGGWTGAQCQLCGKGGIVHWMPVLNEACGRGLFVGEDCARTILGVSAAGITLEQATKDAADKKMFAKVWREIPKAPKPVKPAKPALGETPTEKDLIAVLEPHFGKLRHTYTTKSRAQMEFRFSLHLPDGSGTGWNVKLDVRHGVTIKNDDEKVIVKVKDSQDIRTVLTESIPVIAKDYEEMKKRPSRFS